MSRRLGRITRCRHDVGLKGWGMAVGGAASWFGCLDVASSCGVGERVWLVRVGFRLVSQDRLGVAA